MLSNHKALLVAALLSTWSYATAAQPASVYELAIEARYDEARQQIFGSQRWRWRNTTSRPVEELQLHLYLNAFAHAETTFMRGSGGQLRGIEMSGEGWGWVRVDHLRLSDGTNLKAGERFLAPEDNNPRDQTVAAYTLPAALAPGETLEFSLGFTAQLPEIFARTGVAGDYIFAGQWFPKIGVFDENGWNVHQFHANSEFFADFGDYEVELDLPSRYAGRIGASGEKTSEKVAGDRVQARFVAKGVHDFAWTADSDTLVFEDELVAGRDLPPALSSRLAGLLGGSTGQLPVTRLRLFLQPEHRALKDRYFAAAKAALCSLGLRLGPYPYPELTLVDPPSDGLGSGGMEYPTLVTLGTLPVDRLTPFLGPGLAEIVTVHEIAHQYWYGMVASNEVEESWIDEGFASYFETKILYDHHDPLWGPVFGMSFPLDFSERASLLVAFADPISLPSWRFRSNGSYGLASYDRPARVLTQLERLAGEATFARAMRACFERWRWRHPTTRDLETCFVAELSTVIGEPQLVSFFNQALHSSLELDYAAEKLTNKWVEPSDDEPGFYRSTVDVVRRGEFRHPVEVELRFEDGTSEKARWDGEGRWERFRFERPARLLSATVDPRDLLALEARRLNNSLAAEPDRRPRWQGAGFLAALLGHFFQLLSFFT